MAASAGSVDRNGGVTLTAKEMLMRYMWAKREADEMELKITQLRLKYAAPSAIKYSDMPTAHDANHDLSEYAEKLEELNDLLIKRYQKCIGIEIDIEMRLDRMPEDKQTFREILRHRYLTITDKGRLNSWDEVAKQVGYSERRVKTLHGIALLYFPTD